MTLRRSAGLPASASLPRRLTVCYGVRFAFTVRLLRVLTVSRPSTLQHNLPAINIWWRRGIGFLTAGYLQGLSAAALPRMGRGLSALFSRAGGTQTVQPGVPALPHCAR